MVPSPPVQPQRYLNLIFQGGGVRGIAYAGVLSNMPPYCRIRGVGGTSAGALVAALVSVGKRGKELDDILASDELFDLLDQEEVKRRERLQDAWTQIKPIVDEITGGKFPFAKEVLAGQPPSGWTLAWNPGKIREALDRLRQLSQLLGPAIKDATEIWKDRGLHRTTKLRSWLNKILLDAKFKDVPEEVDLKIVAADISLREYHVFSRKEDPSVYLADAVQASVSIPLFFVPFPYGQQTFIDGGVISNFPSFLFAQSSYPTIGFRLEDVPPLTRLKEVEQSRMVPTPVDSTIDYLLLTLNTLVEAHDKFRMREPPLNFRHYVIEMPQDIPFHKFNLKKTEADTLYRRGQQVVVDWKNYSSPAQQPAFYDPDPQHALNFTISQGDKLLKRHYDRASWIDELNQTVELNVYIEQDWSTRYERTMRLTVTGTKPLVLMRLYAVGLPPQPSSLADHVPHCVEIKNATEEALILVPASNGTDEKGFASFFNPPVAAGQPERKFFVRHTMRQELKHTVGSGGFGVVRYRTVQIATKQTLKLRLRILSDFDHGPLELLPTTALTFNEAALSTDPVNNRPCRVYECDAGQTDVNRESQFEVRVSKAPA